MNEEKISTKENSFIIEAKDFSKYGKEFQLKLISLLIKDRVFTYSIINTLKDIYFSDIYLRNIFKTIQEYYGKYHASPTFDDIKILLTNAGEKMIVYDKLLKNIEEVQLENKDFIEEQTNTFCFTKYALAENEKIVQALKQGNFLDAKKLSFESYMKSNLESARILDLREDLKKVFDKRKYNSFVESLFPTFTLNINKGKGMTEGELCIIVAPSNFGKSNNLAAIARDAAFKGKNVLYFTYEESAEVIMEKVLAGLLDVERNDIPNNEKNAIERLKDETFANFKVVEDKARNATLANIKIQIAYCKSLGFFPDLICIDGLNQLKLPKGYRAKDDNEKYEILTEELKDLLKEEKIPGYAVFQTNRCLDLKTIVEIEDKGKIEIQYVNEGDKILTKEGYKKIIKKFPIEKQAVYKIKLKNGKEIICSAKHEFPTDKGLYSLESGMDIGFKLQTK